MTTQVKLHVWFDQFWNRPAVSITLLREGRMVGVGSWWAPDPGLEAGRTRPTMSGIISDRFQLCGVGRRQPSTIGAPRR